MYAIVDIETTGSSAAYGRITEVAVLIHDGKRVVDEYQTLLNPEAHIPSNITALTGISNEMVEDAPLFKDIANELLDLLNGNVFIAHNVNFDYSFLKSEFENVGLQLSLNKLCTVRLTRKIFPGLKSYSLGRLTQHFGITNEARHRAMGDARATTTLFDKLLENDKGEIAAFLKRNSKEADLPPNLNKDKFEALPQTTGVYYFLDEQGKVLYVGKANNIKGRVRNHFSSTDVVYKQGMKDLIFDINYRECGDELIAFLFESYEIKRLFPPFNKAQKYPSRKFGIYYYEDAKNQLRFSVAKVQKGLKPIESFTSFDAARSTLIDLVKEFGLKPSLCGLPEMALTYHGYQFDGVDDEELRERSLEAIHSFKTIPTSYVIVGEGKSDDEKSVVLVENGVYRGFGFLGKSAEVNTFVLNSVIEPLPDNSDVQRILNQFISKRELIELI